MTGRDMSERPAGVLRVVPTTAVPSDRELLVTLTARDLKSLVREAVREAFTLSERATSEPEILTLKQAAALLNVNHHQIPKLIRQDLPAYRLGNQWRFRRSELLAWLTRRRVSA